MCFLPRQRAVSQIAHNDGQIDLIPHSPYFTCGFFSISKLENVAEDSGKRISTNLDAIADTYFVEFETKLTLLT